MASLPKVSYKGIEYVCVDTPVRILEQLKCEICLELLSEPVSTSCKHLFCGNCIIDLRKCPKCRTEGFKTSPDFVSTGVIEAFKVKCPNSTEGCEWQGELGDAIEHLTKKCEQQTVCPLRCGEKMKRELFENHTRDHCPNRPFNCPHCDHRGVYTDGTSSHYTTCKEFPLLCPGGCRKRIARRVMENHLVECFGPWLQNSPTPYPRPPWVAKLEGYDRMKRNNEQWFSPPVYSHFGGYKMCLRVDSNGDSECKFKGSHVSVYVYLMKGDNDGNLKFPFKGTITVSLLNQEEDSNHCSKDMCTPESIIPETLSGPITTWNRTGLGWGYQRFIFQLDLGYNSTMNTAYLNSDSLFFRVDKFEPAL